MDLSPSWATLLLAGKWCLTGLIYLALVVVVLAVRREMDWRLARPANPALAAPGRLRVARAGTDRQVEPGALLPLLPVTTLGAARDNSLVLGDQFVSGHHARLEWDGAQWWVEDLGSSNGTLVNGLAIPGRARQPLPVGARLELGGMAFELVE